ncbi:cyclin-A1 [Gouania willdenowi]|uniref:Cyclin-A2 n=1 Tax=Gouania willdenowi TaxID=441366 RepID=A0A8C5GQN8_GOUWI|nr:cyclin-A1 [Gouania willdenowi]
MTSTSQGTQRGNHADKENAPASSKAETLQVQRPKRRTVLGVLSENDQLSRSVSETSHVSKRSSVSDNSQLYFPCCPSTSCYDVSVEEACEVVLDVSGQEVVVDQYHMDPGNEDMRLLGKLSPSSSQEASMQSENDKSLFLEERFSVEYVEDIYHHLRESEMKLQARPYLSKHPEISSSMRLVLVDWLVEVVQEYQLHTETLHLAVNYVDRFLSRTAFVKLGKLQLVGTAALVIAAKYEEIFPPELSDFVYITDSTYSKNQVIQMEQFVLGVLAFRMAAPTTHQFLRLFMSIQSVCDKTKHLALYIAELSLLEMDPFLQYHPSMTAAGAYCLASYTLNQSLWPDSLCAFTGYTMLNILPCLTDLHKLHISMESCPQQTIREKYQSSKYSGVSTITPPDALPVP